MNRASQQKQKLREALRKAEEAKKLLASGGVKTPAEPQQKPAASKPAVAAQKPSAANAKKKPSTTPAPVASQSNRASKKTAPAAASTASAAPAASTAGFSKMQAEMQRKLAGSKFRWINERLYTTESDEAVRLFKAQPELFRIYHDGFSSQVKDWPANPVDVFISDLKHKPAGTVIADMGCGEAVLAATLNATMTVHSFDLIAGNELITACDIAHVPLKASTVDVVVFCLSLMGTNFADFLREGHRILKTGGQLKIAEVISRIENLDQFIDGIASMGFKLTKKDSSNKMFVIVEFTKTGNAKGGHNAKDGNAAQADKSGKGGKGGKGGKRGQDTAQPAATSAGSGSGSALDKLKLKPCLYKRR
ncbi:methyltransferase-domain-containing protein [Entophlyctis helioformis]|nr:methyltransferase-domain-containing protein [Entophlyctis helioformis]